MNWASSRPLRIWLPSNEAEWRKIASTNAEQGIFLSDSNQDWIIVNPAASNFLEVLSHEYIHAVLHRTLPNLPTWFEEGICEYYSTLVLRRKGNRTEVIVGQPPARHRARLDDLPTVAIAELARQPITIDSYAPAWAAAYHLWPSYKSGDKFPESLKVGPYRTRTIAIAYVSPDKTLSPLSTIELREIEIEFRNLFPGLLAAGSFATAEAEKIFLEGLRLSDSSQTKEAIPLLKQACQLRPSNSTWWQALALAYQEDKQFSEARIAIERALVTARNEAETVAARTLQKSLN